MRLRDGQVAAAGSCSGWHSAISSSAARSALFSRGREAQWNGQRECVCRVLLLSKGALHTLLLPMIGLQEESEFEGEKRCCAASRRSSQASDMTKRLAYTVHTQIYVIKSCSKAVRCGDRRRQRQADREYGKDRSVWTFSRKKLERCADDRKSFCSMQKVHS